MTARQLMSAFRQWRKGGEALVLASVYQTEGSTYSKAGAQMLITGEGVFQGMLSGGCLEGDLAERAKTVAKTGAAQAVSYDFGGKDEELWGLGVGCDGLMRVFLQRLVCDNDYQPFPSMMSAYQGTGNQISATVIASALKDLEIGSVLVMHDADIAWTDIAEQYRAPVSDIATRVLQDGRSQSAVVRLGEHQCELLLTVLRPIPRVLILGAGLDAEPVVRGVA